MIAALLSLLALPVWFGASTVVQSYVCLPPETPVITSPVAGSTVIPNTQVAIEGASTADSTVTLTDNGDLFATITSDELGHFATQTSFTQGDHILGVASQNPCGSTSGATVSITSQLATGSLSGRLPASSDSATDTGLSLRIISPRDNTTTTGSSIYVAGTTLLSATQQMFLNDRLVANVQRPSLNFGVSVPLTIGDNILRVVVTEASNGAETEEVLLHITRRPLVRSSAASNPTSTNEAWYQTQGGKTALIIAAIFILIVIGILLFL